MDYGIENVLDNQLKMIKPELGSIDKLFIYRTHGLNIHGKHFFMILGLWIPTGEDSLRESINKAVSK